MSGYQKEPDYGGAPVTRRNMIVSAIVTIAGLGAFVWLMGWY